MKKKFDFLDKISTGKGFYVTAAVSVTSVIVAVLVLYSTTNDITRNFVPSKTTTEYTQEAEINITDEDDPRIEEETTQDQDELNEIDETTTEEETTQKQANKEDETTTQATTEQTTKEQEVAATKLNTSYILPLDTDIVKHFSMDNVVYSKTMGDWRVHSGVDFSAYENSEVKSVGNGLVTKVSAQSSWGYIIEVDYGDFVARYCGMKQGTTVSIGTVLNQGDIIGQVDACPCEADEELHLHFEVMIDNVYVDPLEALGV